MAVIYNSTKTHYDSDSDIIPEGGNGKDTHTFNIPSNQKYSHYQINSLSGHALSSYNIVSKPASEATGNNKKIKIDWWYLPFGKVRYRLKVHTIARRIRRPRPRIVRIIWGAPGWMEEAFAAINQHADFKIVIKGPMAIQLRGGMQGGISYALTPTVTIVITIAVAFVIISLAAFATIGVVLIVAMQSGFNAKARFRGAANPLDAEMTIEVTRDN